MAIGRQNGNVLRSGKNIAGVGAGRGPSGKPEDVNDATSAVSGALQSEAGFTHEVLKVDVTK